MKYKKFDTTLDLLNHVNSDAFKSKCAELVAPISTALNISLEYENVGRLIPTCVLFNYDASYKGWHYVAFYLRLPDNLRFSITNTQNKAFETKYYSTIEEMKDAKEKYMEDAPLFG